MKKILIAALAVAFAVPAAQAKVALPFSAAFQQVRHQVMATKKGQDAVRAQSLSSQISRIRNNVRRLAWDAQRMRNDLRDLTRRARNYVPPTNDNRGSSDPFFGSDLRRFSWKLRDLAWDIEREERDAESVARRIQKDPNAVSAARWLVSEVRRLENDVHWLDFDAGFARSDFSRIGFSSEGWEIDRNADRAERSSRNLKRAADDILRKVR